MSELKMPRRQLDLTDEERAELVRIADQDPRPYMREKALALLRIYLGFSPHWVATSGLSPLKKPRHPETVYTWLNDFLEHRQLRPQPPRRTPFSPSRSTAGNDAAADPSGAASRSGV
jgi:hypothetical protein